MDKFYPKMYQRSIYDINYKKVWKMGIRCLLFDLDNTCVSYKESSASDDVKKLFKKLKKQGFDVIIFSNSPSRRLKKFEDLGVNYNAFSMKPFTYNFFKILKKYKYDKEEVMIIGDQIFTDIWGGNKVGIYTCLVEPLDNVDMFLTSITRAIEKYKIKKFVKDGIFERGKYYD